MITNVIYTWQEEMVVKALIFVSLQKLYHEDHGDLYYKRTSRSPGKKGTYRKFYLFIYYIVQNLTRSINAHY